MRVMAAIILLVSLSGCGCVPDTGDSTQPGEYWDGCWEKAKDNRRGQIFLPRGDL